MTSVDQRPEQLATAIRTFLGPDCFHACVKVGVVTVVSTRSSWKSYQCQVLGSLVLWSVSVTCWPAYGCCCSGNPGIVPVGPQVKSGTGATVCVQVLRTTIGLRRGRTLAVRGGERHGVVAGGRIRVCRVLQVRGAASATPPAPTTTVVLPDTAAPPAVPVAVTV